MVAKARTSIRFGLAVGGLIFAASSAAIQVRSSERDPDLRRFDELERRRAYIVGEGGAFLGKISRNKYDRESLANEYGAGSKYKTDGLFNEYGKFGGRYQLNSAFNSYSQTPPKILYERNGELYIVGYLTTNRSFKTANHRFSPHDLKAWINEK